MAHCATPSINGESLITVVPLKLVETQAETERAAFTSTHIGAFMEEMFFIKIIFPEQDCDAV